MFVVHSVCESVPPIEWQRWQEEAYTADIQWPANIRIGENIRNHQISGWTGTSEAGLRFRNDWVSSEGKQHKIIPLI